MATRKISKKNGAASAGPEASPAASDPSPHKPGPTIAGMGASAGGLEAFEEFFRRMPADSGIAFVLVQHLDPEHASLLTELLQRCTAMPVSQAVDGMPAVADSVTIIPPNREMTISHGVLRLGTPSLPRGQRMPIDVFFRSLAEDRGENAIGIILSGSGSDGMLGLRAIHGAGGMALVQEPTEAKFDGMPNSVIRAGYLTRVLPVAAMPQALLSGSHAWSAEHQPLPAGPARSGMKRILMLMRNETGHDFSQYKKSTVGRRIERRMVQHGFDNLERYAGYLGDNPAEIRLLFKELLINVTSFFRDPEAFAALEEALPQLFKDKTDRDALRVWVAGCASGEEAYSIAMLLREFMDEHHHEFPIQLYATDLDDDAIALARAGIYPPNIAEDVTPQRLQRFFVREESGYRVKKALREMVVFATQNVIKDPPFSRLDLLCCRNLMIYLEPELQNRLIATFHSALRPNGILFLSPSEGTGSSPELFTPINRKWKIYRAASTAFSAKAPAHGHSPRPAHGGKLRTQAAGENMLRGEDMTAREGQQEKLQPDAAAGAADAEHEVLIKGFDGSQSVSFSLQLLPDPDTGKVRLLMGLQGQAASAAAAKPARGKHKTGSNDADRISALERDLANTRHSLEATIQAQQASNEEMQSTNEELQSTNEELETSKEELQSVNEELVTVNAELQTKIEQLADIQNDMKNLLDNMNIGTIFLDEQLLIRRFTREAARIFRLVPTDIGRRLTDIKSSLEDEAILSEAQHVLDAQEAIESEIRTRDGSWYLARLQPYRTLDNFIEGVVLTFTDISKRIEAEAAVQAGRNFAEGIVNTVRESLLVLDGELNIISASRSFYRDFNVTPDATIGRAIYDLGQGQWNIPALRELLETILPRNMSFDDYLVEHDFAGIGRHRMLLNARRIISEDETVPLILLAIQVIDKPETPG